MYLRRWFPRIVAFGVAFPFEEVLQLFSASVALVTPDGLDLVLFFSSDEVGWRLGVVGAVFYCFHEWG
jgi:hypothetical protein